MDRMEVFLLCKTNNKHCSDLISNAARISILDNAEASMKIDTHPAPLFPIRRTFFFDMFNQVHTSGKQRKKRGVENKQLQVCN
jgi:hypothetical protein